MLAKKAVFCLSVTPNRHCRCHSRSVQDINTLLASAVNNNTKKSADKVDFCCHAVLQNTFYFQFHHIFCCPLHSDERPCCKNCFIFISYELFQHFCIMKLHCNILMQNSNSTDRRRPTKGIISIAKSKGSSADKFELRLSTPKDIRGRLLEVGVFTSYYEQ